ncbi:putative tetratricopeptide-like helical domain superfamily [Helianthus annuus]|uniref:Putative pentatricopeptide repeat protein n=1 Tax=Helianthus annuus TaxID=4232 RepID=A0A251V6D9_HELAN|nr:putative tetratricopeptide-like helical domain superfamily [Helianthus annuus]KAJ0500573.1 putative tetratricopeptide-like helical domain superfamily [Helianthus annuus]KAJ0516451.1 putative tetratricopeptide-like helical domain superfamily [Helianthus annuus]KAJ0684453.1 putative tetratricopeptide-like helical domain superfamily [Helianthus annuus]KAJ0688390.1 putative tetratricopeptide-like helical domain superfamily [Helianthus annuus]
MYAKCGRVVDARKCFYCMPERNTVSWNALISGYVETGDRFNCFSLFKSMHKEGVRLDEGTFSPLLTVFDSPDLYKQTTHVHCAIIKHDMFSDCSVLNATISAYSGCGSVKDANKVFDGASGERDIVSWNTMLAACLEHDKRALAFNLFSKMQMLGFELDIYTYSSMISSCFEEDITNQGRSLHALIMQSGNVGMDYYAFSTVLRSCADVAALQFGQQIHALALRSGYESNEFVTSDLIVMYSKCGTIEDARRSFETSYKQNAVTWNSMMFAYAQHGQGHVTLDLFSQMKIRKVRMDHMTFVAVLTACSHNGLVEKGCTFLKTMESGYGISPRMEHYACVLVFFNNS